jgi:hypothetical protein
MESYMSQFSPEQLDYFQAFPAWLVAAWAVGVWGSVLGSLALLLRKAWAFWLFGASLLGLAITSVYNFALSDGIGIMGSGAAIFHAVIWTIALLLLFYARAMANRGVLT